MTQQPSAGVEVKIVNIVAASHLIPPFSLGPLFKVCAFTAYPEASSTKLRHFVFPFLPTFFHIFPSGKVFSYGSPSQTQLSYAFDHLRSLLSRYHITLAKDYEIINIVAIVRLAPPLKLHLLASHLPSSKPYDPSRIPERGQYFDSVIYHFSPRRTKPRATALIFSSGFATFTGFRTVTNLTSAAQSLAFKIAGFQNSHPEIFVKSNLNENHLITTPSPQEVMT